ncbi:Uu.00g045430.m01.CDS01 [Anthostomella pinea]|uniref:Uu.00g045430.m01.CDS01 n=1 Tax=Anthostomella pinea TaxID=933095 RepID=A0AAI8YEE0_9PEZI|nr:Uu.00g045430.m01.CDS01 [Anthostomella pinea]
MNAEEVRMPSLQRHDNGTDSVPTVEASGDAVKAGALAEICQLSHAVPQDMSRAEYRQLLEVWSTALPFFVDYLDCKETIFQSTLGRSPGLHKLAEQPHTRLQRHVCRLRQTTTLSQQNAVTCLDDWLQQAAQLATEAFLVADDLSTIAKSSSAWRGVHVYYSFLLVLRAEAS